MNPYVVFDLDGTIANNDHRQHFLEHIPKKWDDFFAHCYKDEPVGHVIRMMHLLTREFDLHVWSGRSDAVRAMTIKWMDDHGVPCVELKMRRDGDYTPDDVLKEQWLHNMKQPPEYVFDDRDKVVDMWRRNGVPCYQVARGSF